MPAVTDPQPPHPLKNAATPPAATPQAPAPPAAARQARLVQAAVSSLRQALAAQNVEAVCGAYHALRNLTDPPARGKLPGWLEQALGLEALHAVISAYSHLHCPMCQSGLVPCESCEGAGHDEGDPCPYCRGLGLAPCSFCRGTGWADRSLLPEELRPSILRRQLLGVRGYASELTALFARVNPQALATMPPEKRRRLGGELIHLGARLAEMAQAAAADSDAHLALTRAARKVENVLRALTGRT